MDLQQAHEARLEDIARGAIEQHLGDVLYTSDEEPDADIVYDEAFVLAHDALLDAGVDVETATRIASHVARCIAQP